MPVIVVSVDADACTGDAVAVYSSRKNRRRAPRVVTPWLQTVTGPCEPRVVATLVAEVGRLQGRIEALQGEMQAVVAAKDAEIAALKAEIARRDWITYINPLVVVEIERGLANAVLLATKGMKPQPNVTCSPPRASLLPETPRPHCATTAHACRTRARRSQP